VSRPPTGFRTRRESSRAVDQRVTSRVPVGCVGRVCSPVELRNLVASERLRVDAGHTPAVDPVFDDRFGNLARRVPGVGSGRCLDLPDRRLVVGGDPDLDRASSVIGASARPVPSTAPARRARRVYRQSAVPGSPRASGRERSSVSKTTHSTAKRRIEKYVEPVHYRRTRSSSAHTTDSATCSCRVRSDD
jgi:hypothetical protein